MRALFGVVLVSLAFGAHSQEYEAGLNLPIALSMR